MNTSMNTTSASPPNGQSKRRSTTASHPQDDNADAAAPATPGEGGEGAADDTGDRPLRHPRTGPLVALATAAAVFALGQALIPGPKPPAPPIAAVITTAQPVAAVVTPVLAPAVVPAPEPLPAAPPPGATAPADAPSVQQAKASLGEKDIAREAWRRNLPDIAEDERHASLLIPIRGLIAGATYRLIEKSRGVVLHLPKAESMITMPFYRLKNGAFTTLWIKQDQGEPTEIRLMLAKSVIKPEVEIKDGLVRVTVTKTAP
jgi:hypothetical protein